MAENRAHPGDWGGLYEELLRQAEHHIARRGSAGNQIEARELVNDTLLRYLDSEKKLGWDGIRPLSIFLIGVMRNVYMESVRKHEHAPTSMAAGGVSDETSHTLPALQRDPRPALETRSKIKKFFATISTDKRFVRFVTTALSLENPEHKRIPQIADKMGITPADARAIEKRLRRRFERLI